jgi:hypothetical protein
MMVEESACATGIVARAISSSVRRRGFTIRDSLRDFQVRGAV